MGCDIHGVIEVKENDSWWAWSSSLHLNRDYFIFGLLAGVRGDGPAIVEPRGLPSPLGIWSDDEWENWKDDAHTASWVSTKELGDVLDACVGEGYFPSDYHAVHEAMKTLLGKGEVRFVFWFDN